MKKLINLCLKLEQQKQSKTVKNSHQKTRQKMVQMGLGYFIQDKEMQGPDSPN